MEFLRECTGDEPVRLSVPGADGVDVCVDVGWKLAVVTVPLGFFSNGGTVECLRAVEAWLADAAGCSEMRTSGAGPCAGMGSSGMAVADRVFLYEDRWRNDGTAVRAMLRVRLGRGLTVFARNCVVRDLAPETAANFLRRHHIYGPARARYRLGLFRTRATGRGEAGMDLTPALVAVATFSAGRRKEDGTVSYEWVRYASAQGVRVTGGMGRLLDAFISKMRASGPMDVMTYADLEWYDGRSYRRLGFEPCGDREPVWFLCRPGSCGRQVCPGGAVFSDENAVRICNLGSRKYISRW